MRSMTGYGRCSKGQEGREMTLEIKAVNHRFLDIHFRFPRSLGFLEEIARKGVAGYLVRGHLDIALQYRNIREDARRVVVDEALLSAYMEAFSRAREQHGLKNDKSISMLPTLPDVFTVREAEEDQEAILALFKDCFQEALQQLIAMREKEGQALATDILGRLDILERLTHEIEKQAPATVHLYREKLRARMEELLKDNMLDESRIAQEVAVFADRCAIDEELVRLASHVSQMRAILSAPAEEGIGRKLDFIVQELNRETNTVGSKASDLAIIDMVVEMKSQIEKIREQVQNIE